MSENSFKSIRNGAISSVIAGIVLLSIPVLRGYVVSFLSWLWSGVVWCWESLVASYSIPGWAWLGISIFSLIGLVNIYLVIKAAFEQPEFKNYIEDHIHGAKWRWGWTGNQIANVWCYCPCCDATLVYDGSSCRNYLVDIKRTDFLCENCGNSVVASIAGGNKDYATSAIMREIGRRIRTGEYKSTNKALLSEKFSAEHNVRRSEEKTKGKNG